MVVKGGSHLCAPNYCLRYRPGGAPGPDRRDVDGPPGLPMHRPERRPVTASGCQRLESATLVRNVPDAPTGAEPRLGVWDKVGVARAFAPRSRDRNGTSEWGNHDRRENCSTISGQSITSSSSVRRAAQNFTGRRGGRAAPTPRCRDRPDHGHPYPARRPRMARSMADGIVRPVRTRTRSAGSRRSSRRPSPRRMSRSWRRRWTRAASPACSSTRTCGPPRSRRRCAGRAVSSSPTAGSRSRPSSPPSKLTRPRRRRSLTCRSARSPGSRSHRRAGRKGRGRRCSGPPRPVAGCQGSRRRGRGRARAVAHRQGGRRRRGRHAGPGRRRF